jgi:hypothetical protein
MGESAGGHHIEVLAGDASEILDCLSFAQADLPAGHEDARAATLADGGVETDAGAHRGFLEHEAQNAAGKQADMFCLATMAAQADRFIQEEGQFVASQFAEA